MKKFIAFLKRLFGIKNETARAGAITSDKRKALVVGIENSLRFGACPGALRDSVKMRGLLNPICSEISVLQNKEATKANILMRMGELIDKVPPDGIFIMTYSGHGGSEEFPDTDKTIEKDGKDEFLCCYDTYLKDDDIWKIVTRCKGKVFLVFDCCHSETMFRTPIIPPGDLFKEDLAGVGSRDGVISQAPVDMLVWSGCPDNTYSYGDSNGGLFTNAFLAALSAGKHTYDSIWSAIKSDKSLSRYSQKPQKTLVGQFDPKNDIWN